MFLRKFFYYTLASSKLLIFLGGIAAQASNGSYFYVKQEINFSTPTLGVLIDKKTNYKIPILQSCLYDLVKPKDGVLSPCTSQEIVSFFEDQKLIPHIEEPQITREGTQTFNSMYGVEFPYDREIAWEELGNLTFPDRVALLTSVLSDISAEINYLDIGGGYGSFVKKVIGSEYLEENLDQVSFVVNDCQSIQCYHAAQLLKVYPQVTFYPRDILGGYNVWELDRRFDLSTCLNVHHFMNLTSFQNSVEAVYNFTQPGGYHIATILSPYCLGDSSELAEEYNRRKTQDKKFPGYFTENDFLCIGSLNTLNLRLPLLTLTPEDYAEVFEKANFRVEEKGYFTMDPRDPPQRFSYIIAQKGPFEDDEN